MIYFLIGLLILGIFFLALPDKYLVVRQKSALSTRPISIEDAKGIIMFVSDIRENQKIESLLSHQVLSRINQPNLSKRHIWLIHGGTSSQPKTSFSNTNELISKFSSDTIDIRPKKVSNINDPTQSFSVVDDIFTIDLPSLNLKELEVVCDCTSGTKAMTIGMALACIGTRGRRLIYFPQDKPAQDKDHFLEIDTSQLLYSVLSLDE